MLTQKNNAGLYNQIQKEADKKGVLLDKNFSVEIETRNKISLLIKIKERI
jgi:hypothetical protein